HESTTAALAFPRLPAWELEELRGSSLSGSEAGVIRRFEAPRRCERSPRLLALGEGGYGDSLASRPGHRAYWASLGPVFRNEAPMTCQARSGSWFCSSR